MKNRKIVFSGIMAAILSAGTANAATGIASVDYVNAQKTALESKIETKADAATTLKGYGITDAYTKGEVDEKVADVVAGDMGEALAAYVKTTTYESQVGDTKDLDTSAKIIVNAINEVRTTANAKLDAAALDPYQTKAAADAAYAPAVTGGYATKSDLDSLTGQVNTLESSVGASDSAVQDIWDVVGADANSGLRKVVANNTDDVAEHAASITKNTNDIADMKNENIEGSLAAQIKANTETIASDAVIMSRKAEADSVYIKTEIDGKFNDYTPTADLTAIATSAPGECSDPRNKCVITWDGTNYGVEVIVRGE